MDDKQKEAEIKLFANMFIRTIKSYGLPQSRLYPILKREFDPEFTRIKLQYIRQHDDGTIPPD